MASTSWGTPAAIVAGFSILAFATYSGLRARAASSAVAVASPPVGSPAPSGAGAAGSPAQGGVPPAFALTAPEAAIAVMKDTSADAIGAFDEKQRPALVASCLAYVKDSGAPAEYEIDLAFNESGHEVGRAINERSATRPDLTACIRAHRVFLDVPPRGAHTQARVPFTIP